MKSKLNISKKKAKYFEKLRGVVKDILVECCNKVTPTKDQIDIPHPLAAVAEEKKKRRITFNDEPSVHEHATHAVN